MTLAELFDGIAEVPERMRELLVFSVTSDTREVAEGSVFVCIKGMRFDGHSAAEEMLKYKGAVAVITERPLGLGAEIVVESTRKAYPELLSRWYGSPTASLALGAVTGTNGKTTVVNLATEIMRSVGFKTGTIGTLGTDTGEGREYTHGGPPTTPEAHRLYGLFSEMKRLGTRCCFMEASSQALHQYRFGAERFRVAAFTNLTQDHLDYHGTMEEYFQAKLRLFTMCDTAIVNIDDAYGRRVAEFCTDNGVKLLTYSVEGEADFYTEMVNLYPDRSEFILTDRAAKKSYPVKLAMTGLYNVSNAIAAALMCMCMGTDLALCLSHLEGVSVEGRLETLYDGKYTIIRDYAHTADGLEKLLSTLKPVAKGRLVALFGAAGDRDALKRPDMAATVAKYADYMVLTSDNPATEDPQSIIDDVKRGVPEGADFAEFTDRREAIEFAVAQLKEGDVLALCGKGHEDYQLIGAEYVPFDEKKIINEILSKRGI